MSTLYLSYANMADMKSVIKDDDAYFAGIPLIHHTNERFTRFRNESMYRRSVRMEGKYVPLQLDEIDIPDGTFMVKVMRTTKMNVDKIVIMDSTVIEESYITSSVLGILHYLHINQIDCKDISFVNYDWIMGKEDDSITVDFDKFVKNALDKLKENGFQPFDVRTRSISELRLEACMSRTSFARYLHIPYRTIENWESGKNKCPDYLFDLIEFKLEKEDMFYCERGEVPRTNEEVDVSILGALEYILNDKDVLSIEIKNETVTTFVNFDIRDDVDVTAAEIKTIADDLIANMSFVHMFKTDDNKTMLTSRFTMSSVNRKIKLVFDEDMKLCLFEVE